MIDFRLDMDWLSISWLIGCLTVGHHHPQTWTCGGFKTRSESCTAATLFRQKQRIDKLINQSIDEANLQSGTDWLSRHYFSVNFLIEKKKKK